MTNDQPVHPDNKLERTEHKGTEGAQLSPKKREEIVRDTWGNQHPAAEHAETTDKTAKPGDTQPAGTTGDKAVPPASSGQTLDVPPILPVPSDHQLDIPPVFKPSDAAPEIPAPIQKAIQSGAPIRFASPGEDQAANRQPNYFFTPEGKLVPNPKAPPSPDGSITIEIQSKDATNNKSLRDAIQHESDMQRQAAKEMIRLFQKDHPGQSAPQWMQDLADAKPNLPDFIPFPAQPNAPATPPPENGFVNRGVSSGGGGGDYSGGGGGGGGRGDSGFAGNGGYDSGGYFRGNGGAGDGTLSTGGSDSTGKPLGPGEQVKAKDIYDYMTEKYHLTPAQASGVLGNMQTESSFKTDAYNKGEGAIGLCQWEGGRRVELEKFAASEGKPVTDWHVQVDFMMHEMKGSEGKAWQALQAATTPAQAASVFDQYYERSSGAARGERMANAENIAKTLNV